MTKPRQGRALSGQEQTRKNFERYVTNHSGRVRDQIGAWCREDVEPDAVLRDIYHTLEHDPEGRLVGSAPISLGWTAMTSARTGLRVDHTAGHGYAVPFRETVDKGTQQEKTFVMANFMAGYKGYVFAARRLPQILTVAGQIRHEKDVFRFREGQIPHHEFDELDRGPIVGAYAYAIVIAGAHSAVETVYYSLAELMQIRESTKKRNNGEGPAWKWGNGARMYWKAPIRRLVEQGQWHYVVSHAAARDGELLHRQVGAAHRGNIALATRDGLPKPEAYTDDDHRLNEHLERKTRDDDDVPFGTESTHSVVADPEHVEPTDDDMAEYGGKHGISGWSGDSNAGDLE